MVVLFGVLTRRGCSGRDVATTVMLIDPAESSSTAVPLYSCLLRIESAMRSDSKRGLTKFTAESVRGALRAPSCDVPKFITHAAAAKALTKPGDTASRSSASSPYSSRLVTLALEKSLMAPLVPFKGFRATALLGDSGWVVVVDVLEKVPDGNIKFSCPTSNIDGVWRNHFGKIGLAPCNRSPLRYIEPMLRPPITMDPPPDTLKEPQFGVGDVVAVD